MSSSQSIHDDPLVNAMRRAAKVQISPQEIFRQRVSFIYGSLPATSDVTKERVERIVREMEGSSEASR